MNRRSFLQFIGLAPIAPTALAAISEPIATSAFRNCIGLPQVSFRAINADFSIRNPLIEESHVPTLGEWVGEMKRAQETLRGTGDNA